MTLKERYENMSDEELLERYKNFQDYRDDAKEAMLEVLRDKKLVGEEEIEKKLAYVKRTGEEKEEGKIEESDKKTKKIITKKKTRLKWYHILIVLFFLNHTNITHLIAIGFDMIGFHKAYVFMLKTTYVLDFRQESALPTKLLADDYFWKKDYKNAQKFYANAHAFAQYKNRNKKIKNETELTALAGYALSNLYLGNYSWLEGDESQILELGEKFKNNNDKLMTSYKEVFDFYGEVSKFFEEKKNYDKALQYLYKREKYVEPWNSYLQYKAIGDIYLKKHDYKNAEIYYIKVIEFNNKNFDSLPSNIKDVFYKSLKLTKELTEKELQKIIKEK